MRDEGSSEQGCSEQGCSEQGCEGRARRTIVREIRGIPFFLLREYLEDLGGKVISDHRVEGHGWRADLEKMKPFRIGSLSVGQTKMTLEIEDHLANDFMERFELKTLRAGA
jgi:hypothetical protein